MVAGWLIASAHSVGEAHPAAAAATPPPEPPRARRERGFGSGPAPARTPRRPQFTPEVVLDPFHVTQGRAVDAVRRAEQNEHDKSKTFGGRWIKHASWSLLKAPSARRERTASVWPRSRPPTSACNARSCSGGAPAALPPGKAPEHLDAWLAWASSQSSSHSSSSRGRSRKYKKGILAAPAWA